MKTTMNGSGLAVALLLATTAITHQARAQETPFTPGKLIISADRLFGLSFSTTKVVDGGNGDTTTDTRTGVAFLWRRNDVTPYEVPRVGVDVDVFRGLTVGGTLGVYSESGTNSTQPTGAATTSRDAPSLTSFIFTPRVGYGVPIVPWFAFWGRLGLSYYSDHSTTTNPVGMAGNVRTNKSTSSGFGLNLEPLFVFLPAPHVGIIVGPYLDVPLSGTRTTSSTTNGVTTTQPDDKLKYTDFGLTVGMLSYFL